MKSPEYYHHCNPVLLARKIELPGAFFSLVPHLPPLNQALDLEILRPRVVVPAFGLWDSLKNSDQ
jgi:hypothetical protein